MTILVAGIGALVAVAGSWQGATIGPVPVFAAAVAGAFLIQWLVFLPSLALRTERYFDLTGSLTYVGITVALLLTVPELTPRSIILGLLVIVWAARLGTFLARRIKAAGSDSRFDEIKKSPLRFLSVWTIQGLWVTLTAAAAWIAITAQPAPLGPLFFVGIALWVLGFVLEVAADLQKSRFRQDPANKGRFITTGVWAWSQHPNYFGEIVMWLGIALASVGTFAGWQYVGLLSPIFVYLLLTRVSGIPLLDRKAQEKWGDDPEFQAYQRQTPVLVPRPPSQQADR